MASENNCPKCGADLRVVGVTASTRESHIYMGSMGVDGLRRIGSTGAREIDQVTCRHCLHAVPAKFVEALHIA